MKYFKRKAIMFILFLFSSLMILFSALLQLIMHNNGSAFFQILVALLFAYDAYLYSRPYLGLDEEQLIINNGLSKKETIMLKNISSIEEKNNKLILTYRQNSFKKSVRILLLHLKSQEKKQFLEKLKLNLANSVSEENETIS